MAIFAGIFTCKSAIELQCRVLLIPWVKKNSGISCSKGRPYSLPYQVRYMKYKQSQTSSPMKDSEDIEEYSSSDPNVFRAEFSNGGKSLHRTDRSYIFNFESQNQNQRPINNLTFDVESEVEEEIDNDLEVEDFEFMEKPGEVVQELGIHQGKDPNECVGIRAGKTKQDVEKLAIEFLATRAFTTVELRKKLHRKGFHLDIVNAVIRDFQSRGLINDLLYAETFSQSRWSSSSWGPRRIKQALFKKGVSEVDAEKAIKLVFEDGESGGDQDSRLGLSKLSLDHLLFQASKQWLRGRDVNSETRISRIIRWLQYRGFSWGVINFVLKKLTSEYPP